MTVELHILKFLLNDAAKQHYCHELPLLGEAFTAINYFQVDLSWQYQNYTVLTKCWDQIWGDSPSLNGQLPTDYIMPFNKYRGMLSFYLTIKNLWPFQLERTFCNLEMEWTYLCHPEQTNIFKESSALGHFCELLELTNRGDVKWPSIQHYVEAKFSKTLSGPNHPCSKCKKPRIGVYAFTNLPTLLRMECDDFRNSLTPKAMKQSIDEFITLKDNSNYNDGTEYRLVGVNYHNGGHYTSRFLRQKNTMDSELVCWNYDGMGRRHVSGRVTINPMVPIKSVWFPYTLPGYYKAVMLYYVKTSDLKWNSSMPLLK